ncbi:sugar transferase [Mucilaginibacter sp. JRF]|uniref:sugar transferase n=1 Tax=Mucilaginibacter sp. JRF TaxID=2780088 RepID=UPI0018808F32|nr:sugar transferase [Mucilaginibacter sp. JRF]MBE9586361.1 sugar transferase [Mucilaginibacter sp. JRF]
MSEINTPDSQNIIALVNCTNNIVDVFKELNLPVKDVVCYNDGDELISAFEKGEKIAAVVSQSEILAPGGVQLIEAIKKAKRDIPPFFLVVNHLSGNLRKLALESGVVDVFWQPLVNQNIESRINFTLAQWSKLKTNLAKEVPTPKKTPIGKRIFDIIFAGGVLLALSPLFLIIYLAIKLESRGPAFYYSLRVGTGYNVFKFYKFRSMYVNADQRVKDLKHLNQYTIDSQNKQEKSASDNTNFLCAECTVYGKCQFPVHADKVTWCEKQYISSKREAGDSAFFKIKNDPRITKVGNFIRNTSIDELPQLWNVIKGDMSIVGNRPLPLYEAEKLTTDKYALRFAAPAGITGLWQVEKRGKGEMSEEERLMLDNYYAEHHSIWNDARVILKTIPALLQKEQV